MNVEHTVLKAHVSSVCLRCDVFHCFRERRSEVKERRRNQVSHESPRKIIDQKVSSIDAKASAQSEID